MNKIIKDQLSKVQIADLSNFNKETNTYYIPKYNAIKPIIGNYYIIKLDSQLLSEKSEIAKILASNWNNNYYPNSIYYKAEIINIMGKYIKINGLGFDYETNQDLNNIWSGWLSLDNIEIIKKL